MISEFQNRTCGRCDSHNLKVNTEWISGNIPTGVESEVVCQTCLYWELLLTIDRAADIFDSDAWIVLEAGQGTYQTDAEREATILYRALGTGKYPRYDYAQTER